MRIPPYIIVLSYAGLIPAFAVPLWRTLAPGSAPAMIDVVWIAYIQLMAAFLAGTFWGFALPAVEGVAGMAGMSIAAILLLISWGAAILSPPASLYLFSAVFLLLLLAEFWRERYLGTIEGYFRLRAVLTLGTVAAIAWRLTLAA